MQPSDDIEAVIQSTNSASPYIVGTGTDILHLEQFFLFVRVSHSLSN